MPEFLKDLFIDEAKPALDRHSGNDSGGYATEEYVDSKIEEAQLSGDGYVLTEVDKQEIAELTAPLVDVPSGGGSSEWVLVGEKTFTEADLGTVLLEFTCDDFTEFHIICQNLLALKDMGLSFMINGVQVTGNTGNRTTEGAQWIQMDLSYRGQVWMAHSAKYDYDSAQYGQNSMAHSYGKLNEGVGKAKRIAIKQSNSTDWQMRSGNVRIYGRQ